MFLFFYFCLVVIGGGFLIMGLPIGCFSLMSFSWGGTVFSWKFSFVSSSFSVLLLVVFLSVLVFSCYYCGDELFFVYYVWMVLCFGGSMVVLLFADSVMMVLISWDLLGVSSFFLVNFFNNWESVSGSMNTILSNRVGDFFLILGVSLFFSSSVFFLSGAWIGGFILSCLILGAFTKSAQYPFSGWLPKAMAAPTPISALVHSSTLVTAGFLLLMKFSVIFNYESSGMLFLFGSGTMAVAGGCAFVEEDLKKIVALSTLSQMGMAISVFGLGAHTLAFFHLISHGWFKSLLFLQVGYCMHGAEGQQDPRNFLIGGGSLFMQIQMKTSLFALCGLFFTSGLLTKDLILEVFCFNSWCIFVFLIFTLCLSMTFFYAFRIWSSLFLSGGISILSSQKSILVKMSGIFLSFSSVSYMWWFNQNFCLVPSWFIYLEVFLPFGFILFFFILYSLSVGQKSGMLSLKFQSDSYLLKGQEGLFNMKFVELLFYSFLVRGGSIFFSLGGSMYLKYKSGAFLGGFILIVLFIFW